jgi:PIN domain nuclease of toxin-antitoxin system
LDASALIAYFLDEEGGSQVESYLKSGACMSTVNWAEVLSKGCDLGKNVDEVDIFVKRSGPSGEGIKFFSVTADSSWLKLDQTIKIISIR